MRVVSDRVAVTFVAFAVMFAHPDAATMIRVVEMIGVEHGLNLLQPQLT